MTDTAATEMIHSLVPLCVTLGITADTAGPNEVVLSLDWAPNLCTGNDVLHGGIVMALADSSGAVCAFLNLPEGAGGTATIESKTNFFAATRSGTVKAHSHRCTSASGSSWSKRRFAAMTANLPPKPFSRKRSCDQYASRWASRSVNSRTRPGLSSA